MDASFSPAHGHAAVLVYHRAVGRVPAAHGCALVHDVVLKLALATQVSVLLEVRDHARRRVVLVRQRELGVGVAGGLGLLEVLLRHADHQLDAVQLVDLGRAGVVVDRHDVALVVHLAQALDDGLAHHVVRQARKRRAHDDVRRAVLDEVAHLGRQQPALAHRVAEREDLGRLRRKVEDAAVRLEALGRLQHLVDGLAHALQKVDGPLVRHAVHGLRAKLAVHVHLVRDAKQEEVHKAGHVRLAALVLDDLHHLVVRRRVELHQDLAHHAHARLAAVVHQGQPVERADGVLAQAIELATPHTADLGLHAAHEELVLAVRRALLRLVRTGAVQALHQQVSVEKGVHRALQ